MYKLGANRSSFSSVLLGSSEGYGLKNRIQIPTDGGTGAVVSDFDFDGHTDLFFWCHRRDGSHEEIGKFGDHETNSFLYFGSPDGFSTKRRQGILGKGVHYDIGTDIGHIRDRGFEFDYVSSPKKVDGKQHVAHIDWDAETPGSTSVRFQLRSASSPKGLQRAPWLGPRGKDTYFTNPSNVKESDFPGGFVQYRAVLDTVNGAESPRLREVRITFE